MQEVADLTELLSKLDGLCNDVNELIPISSIPLPKSPPMDYGFFPGGNGLFLGERATKFPCGGTLILGLNFGCCGGFIDERTGELWTTDERSGATWKGLRHILPKSGIDLDECFFTNAWPFLHKGNNNKARPEKWLNDSELTLACGGFFMATFCRMRPRLIVTLGWGAAEFLRRLSPENFGHAHLGSFSDEWALRTGEAVFEFRADELGTVRAVCFSIKHPARGKSVRRPVLNTDEELREIEVLKRAKKKALSLS